MSDKQTWTTPFGTYEKDGDKPMTFTPNDGPQPRLIALKKKYRG